MSLILDALSRAEREKREQMDPTPSILSQEIVAPRSEKNTAVRTFLLGAGVVAMALVIVSLLYFFADDTSLTTASDNWVSLPAQQGGNSDRQVTSGESPAMPASGKPVIEQSVIDRQAKATADAQPDTLSKTDHVIARSHSSEAVAALYAVAGDEAANVDLAADKTAAKEPRAVADGLTQEQAVSEELIDIERVLSEMRAKAKPEALMPHPTQLLEDLSKQFRDRVPTLMYSSHDFNSAGRSGVVINGETLTPGQRSRGVEVREILADSVILRFEGTDFRLRSLNSWVNL